MSRPIHYEQKKPVRAKRPSAFVLTRLQFLEVRPEANPKLYVKMEGPVSMQDARRMRNWLTSYLRWERRKRGE